MTDKEKLNNACYALKQALKNEYAILRRENEKKDIDALWQKMALKTTQKRVKNTRFFYS